MLPEPPHDDERKDAQNREQDQSRDEVIAEWRARQPGCREPHGLAGRIGHQTETACEAAQSLRQDGEEEQRVDHCSCRTRRPAREPSLSLQGRQLVRLRQAQTGRRIGRRELRVNGMRLFPVAPSRGCAIRLAAAGVQVRMPGDPRLRLPLTLLALTIAIGAVHPPPLLARQVGQGPADQVDTDRPYRVGGDIAAPDKITDVRPIYPPEALARGIQGVVIIDATIGPDGRVREARVLRGRPELDQAALDAVRQWEYAPPVFAGQPVSVLMTVTVNFSLRNGGLEDFGRPGVSSRGGLPLSAPYDLTGEWTGDDGGKYQVRSVGAELFWFGRTDDGTQASIFHGTLQNPAQYRGRWADVPPGAERDSGVMTIRVAGPDRLEVVGETPGFEGRRWQRIMPASPD